MPKLPDYVAKLDQIPAIPARFTYKGCNYSLSNAYQAARQCVSVLREHPGDARYIGVFWDLQGIFEHFKIKVV